jgi:hypothetical protein
MDYGPSPHKKAFAGNPCKGLVAFGFSISGYYPFNLHYNSQQADSDFSKDFWILNLAK